MHNFLCNRSKYYHSWHHHPKHQHIHFGVLAVYVVTIVGLLLSNIVVSPHFSKAASSPWAQTDWSGGTGTSTTNQYSALENTTAANNSVTLTQAADWFNAGWKYRKKITFNNTTASLGVTSEALINFPVLVKLDKDVDIDYSKTKAAGADIRFADPENPTTALSYEIEKWDSSGSSYIWVKIPQIDFDSNTDFIYLYYGNSDADDAQNITDVWSNGYQSVQHMNNATDTTVADSANPAFIGTKRSAAGPVATTGKIGSGQLFTATSGDYIDYGNILSPGTNNVTIEVWYNPNTAGSLNANILYNKENIFEAAAGGGYATYAWQPHWNWDGGTAAAVAQGSWHKTDVVYDKVKQHLYQNGYDVYSREQTGAMGTGTSRVQIGARGDTSHSSFFSGTIDEFRVSWVARSAAWLAAAYKSDSDSFTSYAVEEPQYQSAGSLTSAIFNTDNLSDWGNLSYTATTPAGTTVAVRVRTGNQNDLSDATDFDSCADKTNDGDLTGGCSPDLKQYVQYKIYLSTTDAAKTPTISSISIAFSPSDQGDPNNPASLASSLSAIDGSAISTDTFYNYATPYFTWNEPSDPSDGNGISSGIAGYYIYFGTSATGDPGSQRGIATDTGEGVHYQTKRTFAIGTDTSAMVSGNVYYIRIETVDNAGNIKHLAAEDPSLFIYKYDSTVPSNPALFSSVPLGWFRAAADIPAFSWPTSGGNMATDTGGSTLLGYQYRINGGTWYGSNHTGLEDQSDIITAATGSYTLDPTVDYPSIITGENTFELRTWDKAGNCSNQSDSNRTIKALFYFNASAPTAVRNLSVDPPVNTVNLFDFSWDIPDSYNGSINHYRYYVNDDNDPSKVYTTTETSISGVKARVKGLNNFYIQAIDSAGNAGDLTSVSFIANTSKPDSPSNLTAVDGSNRDTKEYKIFLTWTEPENKGAGFNGYTIYRSTDNKTFTAIGSNDGEYASTTYADTNLESKNYYYYVKSKDDSAQYSDPSETINILPTGKYKTAPYLTDGPEAVSKSFSVEISWLTDREANTIIKYGTDKNNLNQESSNADELVKKHFKEILGLEPETTYYYQVVWIDSDGNRGTNTNDPNSYPTFTTGARPKVSGLTFIDVGVDSAIVSWQTSTLSNCAIVYGEGLSFSQRLNENTGSLANEHSQKLYNLKDGTQYYLRIQGIDSEKNEFSSDDYNFSTLPLPRVDSVRFETVPDSPTTTVKVTWKTNVKTTSIVDYSYAGAPTPYHKSDATYALDHEVVISDLNDKTTYTFTPKGVDEHGNQTVNTESQTFTTPNDTRPPKLSNMTVEIKSAGFGTDQKAQIIVAWQTDEPATSQIEYDQGISGNEYANKSREDTALSTAHAVVVPELEPSKIYHLRAVSRDASGNPGYSDDTTTITGKSQNSILDIIMNSLQRSLGWVFGIFGQ